MAGAIKYTNGNYHHLTINLYQPGWITGMWRVCGAPHRAKYFCIAGSWIPHGLIQLYDSVMTRKIIPQIIVFARPKKHPTYKIQLVFLGYFVSQVLFVLLFSPRRTTLQINSAMKKCTRGIILTLDIWIKIKVFHTQC